MKTVVVALVVVVAVLGGFLGGYKVGQSNVSAATSSNSGRSGANGSGFNRQGGGTFAGACPSPGSSAAAGAAFVARGRITAISATSLTITATGAGGTTCTVTIDFGSGTVVTKQATGSTSDLQDSQTVTVIGTRQADGSVKAATIAIGGAGGLGPGGAPSGGGG
jgi:hypothetical protein